MRLLGGPCEILGRLIWGRKLLRLLGGASGPRPKTVFQNEFADLAVVHKSAIDDDGEGLSVTLRKLNHEAIQADPDEQVAGRLSQNTIRVLPPITKIKISSSPAHLRGSGHLTHTAWLRREEQLHGNWFAATESCCILLLAPEGM